VKFLVVTHKHALLPFAWRLRNEGHEVQVAQVAGNSAYQRAWGGRFDNFLEGVEKRGEAMWEGMREVAEAADATVLTNSRRCSEVMAGYPKLYGVLEPREVPPVGGLWVGGWFNGSKVVAPHLWVEDIGAWTGGQGPAVPTAGALVRLGEDAPWLEVLRREEDYLKAKGFRGLVGVAVMPLPPNWEVQALGLVAGWRPLHTHAFVSELDPWGEGFEEPVLPRAFVVVAAMSVPPWPNRPAEPVTQVPIEFNASEPAKVRKQVFFHDMAIEDDHVMVAGLDGLVGVVRGAGDRLGTARGLCQLRCMAIKLAGRQYRTDAGVNADRLLGVLDDQGRLTSVLR
jgi:hypothetical protein